MKMSQLTNLLLRQGYRRVGRRVLFNSYGGDPERIHEAMISALARAPKAGAPKRRNPVTVAGISFPNRVGLASGMDKDGLAAH
ncbi:MAG: dihydroorotate dehydrogenase (quinone), partial [Propionibacteriaceae bacterium]|nr:dihydroorotate dehydrogenase (quinone) [Propionibacteriaceae bacterium]